MSKWKKLNDDLKNEDKESSLLSLLDKELKEGKRVSYALRIHGRYNSLRLKREREHIVKRCSDE